MSTRVRDFAASSMNTWPRQFQKIIPSAGFADSAVQSLQTCTQVRSGWLSESQFPGLTGVTFQNVQPSPPQRLFTIHINEAAVLLELEFCINRARYVQRC
jgi:hypothetical protein